MPGGHEQARGHYLEQYWPISKIPYGRWYHQQSVSPTLKAIGQKDPRNCCLTSHWKLSWVLHGKSITRAGVKYVFVFANTNTNTNTAYLYLYLYLIKFQTMYLYLYLYLIHRIWCIWQVRFQIHFFPGPFSKHKFMEHKLTWIFFINMLKSVIFFSK